ncbi:hypothetical protein SAMN05216276_100417 [Streptosporangium subroseum]|uniref:FtsX extracellular domain-containing protein n=1 Tax=Streptosporangium subroseum TaxID=106412 RepID=A0A239BNH0_9ACTN|nr:permease-like cell division protein FtsX [Streptosporangium subroseum]SNS09199.1 hypothetical protein SAMN05216276_100417 [Streptosporangium subroseum]
MTYEELAFGGGDPDRESWLRSWVAAHIRLLIASLVVLSLAGAGGWYLYERSWLPQPPPDVALSPSLEFEVTMCGCDGITAATVEQWQEAEAMLRAMPQVTSVKVKSGQEVADQRRRSYEGIGDTKWVEGSSPYGDVLRGVLRRAQDFPAIVEKMRSAPRVAMVLRSEVNFWAGKAEAAITLCGQDLLSRRAPGCRQGKRAGATGTVTEEEKAAIVARLRDLPGVQTIYFQDSGYALKLVKLSHPDYKPDEPMPGSFFVKFSDPALAREIAPAIEPMPGVVAVGPVLPKE